MGLKPTAHFSCRYTIGGIAQRGPMACHKLVGTATFRSSPAANGTDQRAGVLRLSVKKTASARRAIRAAVAAGIIILAEPEPIAVRFRHHFPDWAFVSFRRQSLIPMTLNESMVEDAMKRVKIEIGRVISRQSFPISRCTIPFSHDHLG